MINRYIKGYTETDFDIRLKENIKYGFFIVDINGVGYKAFREYEEAEQFFDQEVNEWSERTQ